MPPKRGEQKTQRQPAKEPSTQKGHAKKLWTKEQADEAQQILLDTSNGFITRGKNKGKPIGSTDVNTGRPYTYRGIATKTNIPFGTIRNWRDSMQVEECKVGVTPSVGKPLLSACECAKRERERDLCGFLFFQTNFFFKRK